VVILDIRTLGIPRKILKVPDSDVVAFNGPYQDFIYNVRKVWTFEDDNT